VSEATTVEVIRRFVAALEETQVNDDWQPVFAEVDADVEVDDLDISLDTEHYRGHDAVRAWVGVWNEAWASWRIEGVEVRPVGEDRAVALFVMVVTAREVASSFPGTMLWSAPCAPGRSRKWATTTTSSRPSKPWAWRSRRCRRRAHDAVGVTLDG
jgi:hypothetical protein